MLAISKWWSVDMKLAFIAISFCALLASPAGSAAAQSTDWTGFYVGASVSQSGGFAGDIRATIDPARDARFTYATGPVGGSFSRKRNLDDATGLEVRGGRLFETDGQWLWGVEAQARTSGLGRTVVIGPVYAGPAVATAPSPLGSVSDTRDTLTSNLDIDFEGSLRARISRQFGKRLLVSAFAGPAALHADLDLTQDSVVSTFFSVLMPPFRPITNRNEVRFSVGGDTSATVYGGTVGAGVDVKLTDRWLIRAEGSLSKYNPIKVSAPAYGGTGSNFTYQPEIYAASLGIVHRF